LTDVRSDPLATACGDGSEENDGTVVFEEEIDCRYFVWFSLYKASLSGPVFQKTEP